MNPGRDRFILDPWIVQGNNTIFIIGVQQEQQHTFVQHRFHVSRYIDKGDIHPILRCTRIMICIIFIITHILVWCHISQVGTMSHNSCMY